MGFKGPCPRGGNPPIYTVLNAAFSAPHPPLRGHRGGDHPPDGHFGGPPKPASHTRAPTPRSPRLNMGQDLSCNMFIYVNNVFNLVYIYYVFYTPGIDAATIILMTFRVMDNSDSCLLNIVQQCNLMLMALNYINKMLIAFYSAPHREAIFAKNRTGEACYAIKSKNRFLGGFRVNALSRKMFAISKLGKNVSGSFFFFKPIWAPFIRPRCAGYGQIVSCEMYVKINKNEPSLWPNC